MARGYARLRFSCRGCGPACEGLRAGRQLVELGSLAGRLGDLPGLLASGCCGAGGLAAAVALIVRSNFLALASGSPVSPSSRCARWRAAAAAGAHRESLVFELPPLDGSDRLRPGELRRSGPLARPRTDRIRGQRPRSPRKKVELPIDSSGEIAGLANAAFAEPGEIGRLLADSRACQECIVKQLFRYAFGRLERPADRETIRSAFAVFRESGFKFKELLVALVRLRSSWTAYRHRSGRPWSAIPPVQYRPVPRHVFGHGSGSATASGSWSATAALKACPTIILFF